MQIFTYKLVILNSKIFLLEVQYMKKGVMYTAEGLDFDLDTKTAATGNNSNDLLDEDGFRNAFEF